MSRPDPQASPEATGPAEAARPPRRNPFEGLLPLLTTGLVVLGGGFYWGWTTRANLKPSLEQLRAQEQDQLLALGWNQSADGVLTRWCREDCNPPKLFGGGRAEVFEVWCRQRPCGNIRATFKVLNKEGAAIGTTTSTKSGLQGERLRMAVVSPEPQAARFELEQFSAQAMVY
jgi:hypothetical protein